MRNSIPSRWDLESGDERNDGVEIEIQTEIKIGVDCEFVFSKDVDVKHSIRVKQFAVNLVKS